MPEIPEAEIEEFEKWLTQFDISEKTIKNYIFVVKHFFKNTNGELTQFNINSYIKQFKNWIFYAGIKKFLEFKGLNIKIQKPKYRRKLTPKPPSIEEIKKNLNEIENKDLYWIIKIGLLTGARIHEILFLRLKDIVEEENTIIFRKTKTNEERKVYVKEQVIKDLISYLKNEKGILGNQRCFFTNTKNIHSAYVYMRKLIDKYIKDKKLAKKLKRTHNIRRTVINYILEKTNMNILIAKEFIGHSSFKTTERYISELTKEEAKKIVSEKLMEVI